jgi:hypothetical protein
MTPMNRLNPRMSAPASRIRRLIIVTENLASERPEPGWLRG